MKQIITHEYYASSPGVDWGDLISEAFSDAQWTHGVEGWKLEAIYEYDREVMDEKGRCVDVEARVVVKHTVK